MKRFWQKCVVGVAVMLVGCGGLSEVMVGEAMAAPSTDSFYPGRLISDEKMMDYGSMSEADIQAFLSAKNGCGNRDYGYYQQLMARSGYVWHWADGHFVCLSEERFGDGEVIGTGDTAAHIIWQAAVDNKINPQVLLVMLQKETGLITDPIPNNGDYRKAMGYGCPDTAACSSQYYGFKNQVFRAAELMRDVMTGGWSNYPVGERYVAYHPNAACGGAVIHIQNRATSALYGYTPYQPNAAAWAAGYGTGDACSSYGNRNYVLYFVDWFGSTGSEVDGGAGGYIDDGSEASNPPQPAEEGGEISSGSPGADLGIRYLAFERGYGFTDLFSNGETLGSPGRGRTMEAIRIRGPDREIGGSVKYRVYLQGQGWTGWVENAGLAGNLGRGARIGAVQVYLTGNMARLYNVRYRAYVDRDGWLGWTQNGGIAGALSSADRMEALQIELVRK